MAPSQGSWIFQKVTLYTSILTNSFATIMFTMLIFDVLAASWETNSGLVFFHDKCQTMISFFQQGLPTCEIVKDRRNKLMKSATYILLATNTLWITVTYSLNAIAALEQWKNRWFSQFDAFSKRMTQNLAVYDRFIKNNLLNCDPSSMGPEGIWWFK